VTPSSFSEEKNMAKQTVTSALWVASFLLVACGNTSNNNDAGTTTDAGTVDAGTTDAGMDAGTTDGGMDAGMADAGMDAGTMDAGTMMTITIQNFMYTPQHLTVAPGAMIMVMNMDTTAHTVTSEAAMDDFTPGAVNGIMFDTGSIAVNGTATISIPANAQTGTVVPFFCSIHTSAMPQGDITIQ